MDVQRLPQYNIWYLCGRLTIAISRLQYKLLPNTQKAEFSVNTKLYEIKN